MEVLWIFFTSPIHIAEGVRTVVFSVLAAGIIATFSLIAYKFASLFKSK